MLAQEIKKVVEQRSVIYEKDGGDWKTRSAGFGDCAVLIQSRTKLKEYEAALQREGIPYRVVGGIGFYEEDEVQAVMNVLFSSGTAMTASRLRRRSSPRSSA